MSVATPTYDNLRVQYSFDNVTWQDFGTPRELMAVLRTRRFAPAGGADIEARYLRFVGQNKSGDGTETVSIGKVTVHTDEGDLSACRQIPFSFNTTQFYSIWLSDQTADIFSRGTFLASVPIPHRSEDLRGVTYKQSLDTLILFHPDYPPHRIFRQGAHTEWDSRPQAFSQIPIFDYTGDRLGGENAQQQIKFNDYVDGDVFNITLGDETTGSISYSSAGVAASVASALKALSLVDANDVQVTGSGAKITITFVNENGNREWPEMFCRTLDGDGSAIAATLVRGKAGGEPVLSATRGYPRCGTFFEQRGWMGGLRSRPSTLLASLPGLYFNYNSEVDAPDAGLDITLDGRDVTEIQHFVAGQHLLIFTSSSEHFVATSPIARDTISIPKATSVGVRFGIAPVPVDEGSVLFIERRSGAVREFIWDDNRRNYEALNLSINASHLLPDPIDMTRRPGRSAKEADLVLIPNAYPHPMAALTFMRTQEIAAFTRFTTPGEIMAVGVEDLETPEIAVKRGDDIYLEALWDDNFLDGSILTFYADPISQVDGLDHLEGEEVVVMQNGHFICRTIVTDGVAPLPIRHDQQVTVSGDVEVGLEFPVHIQTLPVRRQNEEGGYSTRRIRIVRIDLNFEQSGPVLVAANGSNFYEYSRDYAVDTYTDQPIPLFTQTLVVEGFQGATDRPFMELKQKVPAPFHLRSINMEMSE